MEISYHTTKSLKFIIAFCLWLLVLCGWISAQTSLSETKNNINRSTITNLKDNRIDESRLDNDEAFGNAENSNPPGLSARQQTNVVQNQNGGNNEIIILSSKSSDGEKPIEVFAGLGESKTQKLTIKNSGDSPLLWSLAPAGSEQLLFRLYNENRDLSEVSLSDSDKLDDAVCLIVYQNKVLLTETTEQKNNGVKSENFSKLSITARDKKKIGKDVLENSLINNVGTILPENLDRSINHHPYSPHSETPESIQEIDESYLNENYKDGDLLSHLKIFNDYDNADYLNEQLQIFLQWYTIEECGYPKFNPSVEVWEVTSDGGDHWQQIFQIDEESYILNAQCFNPVDFLERYCTDANIPLTSELTSLKELIYQVQTVPSLYPSSGIIQADGSEIVELSFDAKNLDGGIYYSQLVLMNKLTSEVLKTLPIEFIVKPKIEELNSSQQLLKETTVEQLPDRFGISQNYPNPFNPETKIDYSIKFSTFVSLKVYDILGNEIATLVNEKKDAGFYSVIFDASNRTSGIYFYQFNADNFVETKKMILLR